MSTTSTTRVVNVRGTEPYDVYIGRATGSRPSAECIWGNPLVIGRDGDRAEVIAKYEQYLLHTPALLVRLGELRGKVLGCYCKPSACHGDVLVRYANGWNARRQAKAEALLHVQLHKEGLYSSHAIHA